MKEQPEVTVVTRRANQIRNLGKERSEQMHAQNADRIDFKTQRHADKMAAKAEKAAARQR